MGDSEHRTCEACEMRAAQPDRAAESNREIRPVDMDNENQDRFAAMPKLDLHCHLDGSIDPELIRRWLEKTGRNITPEQVKRKVTAPERCLSLKDYLDRFDLPLQYVQQKENLEECAYDLAIRVHRENVIYLETRFAPGTSVREGLTQGEAIDAVLAGLKKAEEECGIRTGLICCAMRHQPEESNLTMLREARERLHQGVAAVDLAGDEESMPNVHFRNFFEECRKLDMPFTIHSGETGSLQNVRDAIGFGARRIGHGIAMKGDPGLEALCALRHVGVELCPTSNFQTGACPGWEDYPLREFMKAGIPVSINTDNRTVSDTDMTRETGKCARSLSLTDEELHRIFRDSVDMAFADDSVKAGLLERWV